MISITGFKQNTRQKNQEPFKDFTAAILYFSKDPAIVVDCDFSRAAHNCECRKHHAL